MHFLKYLSFCLLVGSAVAADKPNILWITSEDNGPHLGCYGDKDAVTPHLDGLAKKSLRYDHCWSVAPVCAPSRTTLITGVYPSSTGAEHMRSMVPLPEHMKLLPQFLRTGGYYCTNNSKEDYNVRLSSNEKKPLVWDESSNKAHYKNRPAGQPFFAVFNDVCTHESQTRKRPHAFVHDPAKITIPGCHPDLPEVRKAWAQVYDQMTIMDGHTGKLLEELEQSGQAADTIIFYYGDHGTGLARYKRYPGESGLRVPLIVHFPEKWKHLAPKDYTAGGSSSRLVSFVDFAPTLLSIAGVEIPSYFQGIPFAGKAAGPAREFNHGLRGRMDERYDLARSVTDGRYVYIKNYYPHLPWGQQNAYMFVTPLTQEWHAAYKAGSLKPEHARFWEPKGPEELYDLQSDPAEVKNLATDPAQAAVLEKLRQAQQEHALKVHDVALQAEANFGDVPAESKLDVAAILPLANEATNGSAELPEKVKAALTSPVPAARYWAVMGVLNRGKSAVAGVEPQLEILLKDADASVRIIAAAVLAANGPESQRQPALDLLLAHMDASKQPYFIAIAAFNLWDNLPEALTSPFKEKIAQLPKKGIYVNPRCQDYLIRFINKITGVKGLDE